MERVNLHVDAVVVVDVVVVVGDKLWERVNLHVDAAVVVDVVVGDKLWKE